MAEKKRGLGRGLEALIPGPEVLPGIRELPIESLNPSPTQPRRGWRGLEELANSIRENGVLQPLVVTETREGYQIIAGERRWRAARMAGLSTVPVLVREATPQGSLIMALVENLQREDLAPLEAANAYQELVSHFGLTQEEVAQRVGKDRATVANTLRLLKLPEEAKRALGEERITEGHARALLALEGAEVQLRALKSIIRRALSVRQTEEFVRRLRGEGPARRPVRADPHTQDLEKRLREGLGTRVQIVRGKKGGRLIVYFYSEEDLTALLDRLLEG